MSARGIQTRNCFCAVHERVKFAHHIHHKTTSTAVALNLHHQQYTTRPPPGSSHLQITDNNRLHSRHLLLRRPPYRSRARHDRPALEEKLQERTTRPRRQGPQDALPHLGKTHYVFSSRKHHGNVQAHDARVHDRPPGHHPRRDLDGARRGSPALHHGLPRQLLQLASRASRVKWR